MRKTRACSHLLGHQTMAKRGSSLCANCGCSNGNRAEQCKECKMSLSKKAKKSLPPEPRCVCVSHLVPPCSSLEPNSEVYSVRLRSQGPDYRLVRLLIFCGKSFIPYIRCFVSRGPKGDWKCHNDLCREASQGRARSSFESGDMHCVHITKILEVKSCFNGSHHTYTCLSESVLQEVPFPPSVMANFEMTESGQSHSTCV